MPMTLEVRHSPSLCVFAAVVGNSFLTGVCAEAVPTRPEAHKIPMAMNFATTSFSPTLADLFPGRTAAQEFCCGVTHANAAFGVHRILFRSTGCLLVPLLSI